MSKPSTEGDRNLDAAHAWRSTRAIASHWRDASSIDPRRLRHRVSGAFWETLAELRCTVIVGREYEHFLVALNSSREVPRVSLMPLPHPSGVAVDLVREQLHVASTRNPNQLFTFEPVRSNLEQTRMGELADVAPLVPTSSKLLPGRLYLHDLVMVAGSLVGASAGMNAAVGFGDGGAFEPLWWPRCVERDGRLQWEHNYVQLNSIAAGPTLATSYFSASSTSIEARRPGHLNYEVDRRGVVFSGESREPIVVGLTRPHSARLSDGRLYVDNSGYGELAVADLSTGNYDVVRRLPGWTRGLCIQDGFAVVGTSHVISRFRRYAPGLSAKESVCGVHIVSLTTGEVVGSLVWPEGDQIFAIEILPDSFSRGFASTSTRERAAERDLFFSFSAGPRPFRPADITDEGSTRA